jgi:trehalose-6-phosphatase
MLIIQNIIYAYVVDWHRHLLNRLYSDSRQYLVSFRDKQEVHNKSIEVKYSQI